MKKFRNVICVIAIFSILSVIFTNSFVVQATNNIFNPDGKVYELESGSDYNYTSATACTGNTSYGKKAIGSINIYGSDLEESTYNSKLAYGATGEITLGYNYDGSFQSGVKSEWNLMSESTKTVGDISVGSKVKKGVIIIQKSTDGSTWVDAMTPVTNFFNDNVNGSLSIYTVTESELKQGTYFRMVVAYGMEKQLTAGSWSDWDGDWERHQYVEIYEFYLCYEANPITIHDLVTRSTISSAGSTSNGFYINKNGSSNKVTVSKDGGTEVEAADQAVYTDSGNYTIKNTTKLGKTFTSVIKINDGLQVYSISPTVYESDDNKGYTTDTPITSETVYGATNFTQISIAQNANYELVTSTKNGLPSYGIAGDSINIFIKLLYPDTFVGNGWTLSSDTWGKKTNELVDGVQTGTVGTGAIVIQKSTDGTNWVDADAGRYASGLYTTSFGTYYESGTNILLYTPKGEDVVNGLYLRILYAYEVEDSAGKNYKNYLEEYKFYLCSSDLEAITFHNLSITDELESMLSEEDQITMDLYMRAETLLDGAYTTTGFQIDKTLNPKSTVSVKRNGYSIGYPDDGKFDATGKYEITIKSDVGNTKVVTIYVDTMTDDESLEFYFGDSFITGKRIYSEGQYPVFEAGLTEYHFNSIDSNYKNITGQLINTTTGTTTELSSSSIAKTGVLNDAGHYVAQFTTNEGFDTELKSGDAKIFTFEFDLISSGTAPGPKVNQRSLDEYAHSTMVDSYPMYYGLSYSSAAGGNITIAYSDKDTAFSEAYNYESGTVEVLENGTYRYIGSFIIGQKDMYDSAWDVTAAANYFAEQAVQKLFFDMSDTYSYTTLTDELIDSTTNLRQLELARSVFIFGDGQKEILTNLDVLPFINDKPYSYLSDGINQTPTFGTASFMFVSDKYGCDSDNVIIIDKNGTGYSIEYNKSVGQQLQDANCPSGVVTIHEETVYKDSTEYQAVFINEGDNTAQLEISYYSGDEYLSKTFTQDDDGNEGLSVDLFTISSVVDELDPYGIVKVSGETGNHIYCIDSEIPDSWAVPGDYEVTCVNRLGYSYSINVHVNESDRLVISFTGDGADDLTSIITSLGSKNIELPKIEKYGYRLVGFIDDETDNMYTDIIEEIDKTGQMILRPIWEPLTCFITLEYADETVIDNFEVTFGRTYELPVPDGTAETGEFLYWTKNGESVSDNSIYVDFAEDITLVAKYANNNDISISANQIDNTGNSKIGIIITVIVFLLGGAGFYVYKYKNVELMKLLEKLKKKSEENDSSDESISDDREETSDDEELKDK